MQSHIRRDRFVLFYVKADAAGLMVWTLRSCFFRQESFKVCVIYLLFVICSLFVDAKSRNLFTDKSQKHVDDKPNI